jgi:hypothetical protein
MPSLIFTQEALNPTIDGFLFCSWLGKFCWNENEVVTLLEWKN